MNISDLYSITKKEHNFKINEINGSSTLWKKDIYIVKRSHNWYKIGVSNNVNERIRQMQVCSPETLIDKKDNLSTQETSGEWVKLEGSNKDISKTFEFIVNKTVNSLRRKYRADNKAIEKLITNYKPTYNAISILK